MVLDISKEDTLMKRIYPLFLFTAVLLTACGGLFTPVPTPTPTPEEWLDRAAAATLAITSAQFTLTREGAPVALDPSTGTTFTEAAGKYQAPDRVSASVKVTVLGSVLSLDMLWLPEGNYVSNPFTGAYEQAPAAATFNGMAIFGADGMAAVLKDGIQNVTMVGTETVEDVETFHLKGEADGGKLSVLTAGALATGTLYPVDVWMDATNYYVVRIHVAEPDGNGWQIDLFAFNEPVEIKAP